MIGETNSQSGGSSQERITVRLATNQSSHSDVMGAGVTFVYGGESRSFVWDGNDISLSVPAGTECSVSFGQVDGYRTPQTVHFVTVTGNTRQMTGLYESCRLTVSVLADQGGMSGHEVVIEAREVVGIRERYDRLEYIESTGQQYIDTGYKPNGGTRIVMDIEKLGTDLTVLFGNQDESAGVGVMASSSTVYYNYAGDVFGSELPASGGRVTVDADRNVLTYGDVTVQADAVEFSSDKTEFLFVSNFTGGSVDSVWTSARLYSCRIYDGGVIVRDYVPAMNREGIAGLYDTIGDGFYPSGTATPFRGGEPVRNILYRQTARTASYSIPYGKLIRVTASDVTGFITPPIQELETDTPQRTVSLTYVRGGLNVWVATSSGKLIDPDNWKYYGSETPVGVAVITENSSFVVKGDMYAVKWTSSGYESDFMPGVPAATETELDNGIHEYYDGISYTEAICRYGTSFGSGGVQELSYYVSLFNQGGQMVFGDRSLQMYVGSTGEWSDLGDNYKKVVETLRMIGMEFRYSTKPGIGMFWTSCQCAEDATRAWAMIYYPEIINDNVYWFAKPEKSLMDEYEGAAFKPFYKL